MGSGKRGGARVIYFLAPGGTLRLLIVYAKAKFDNKFEHRRASAPLSFHVEMQIGGSVVIIKAGRVT